MKRGLLLVAHGARNPAWAAPFERLRERLQHEQPDRAVALAFLELMEPAPAQALQQLAAAGVGRVEVLPMFLGGAGHVQRDLAPLLDTARTSLGIDIQVHAALGEQAAMLDAMTQLCLRLLEAGEAP
ncbi:sirohydrochlorin chelatase [Inhella sp.]|uniref:sirohydrochlorin chelatase n=1 Tax=Inhella sp. TaxID=1921806 RepID=UPI0035B1DF7B